MTIKEDLRTERIPQLKKRIQELEKEIDRLYKKRGAENWGDFEWYKREINPLSEEQESLKRLIMKIERFNVKVGDGVTINLYSDCHGATVIKRTPYTITIQQDLAIRTDNNGMSECQEYMFERNPKGAISTYRWSNKYGCFCNSGDQSIKITNGRYEYFDYSF